MFGPPWEPGGEPAHAAYHYLHRTIVLLILWDYQVLLVLHIDDNLLYGHDVHGLSSLGKGQPHLLPVRLYRTRSCVRRGSEGIRHRHQANSQWRQPSQELVNEYVRQCGLVLHRSADELFQQGTWCLPALYIRTEYRTGHVFVPFC